MSHTDKAGQTYNTSDGREGQHGSRVTINTSSGTTSGTMVGGLAVADKK